MAAGVVKQFNYKRANNTYVFTNQSGGRADLLAEAPLDSEADQNILNQITARRDAAQGNVDELNNVLVAASS